MNGPLERRRPQAHAGAATKAANRLRVCLDITFRVCTRKDLRALEWEGLFRQDRRLIEGAFRRQKRGDNVMLIAEANGLPVGQVWLDLALWREARAGWVWAMRVLPWFQRTGIGTRLMLEAEKCAERAGCTALELWVDKTNKAARQFYRRIGFDVTAEILDHEYHQTKAGRLIKRRRPRYSMRKLLGPSQAGAVTIQ